MCVEPVLIWPFGMPYFTRNLRHEHDVEDILCLYHQNLHKTQINIVNNNKEHAKFVQNKNAWVILYYE